MSELDHNLAADPDAQLTPADAPQAETPAPQTPVDATVSAADAAEEAAAPEAAEAPAASVDAGAPEAPSAPAAPQAPGTPEAPEPADAQDPAAGSAQTESPAPAPKPRPQLPTRAEMDAQYVARAADPAEYELLRHDVCSLPGGPQVSVYAACRIGLGHIGKKTPCQDYCDFRKIRHGVVLLDADGISACDKGEYGSRRACEIAGEQVEQLSLRHTSEDAFIRELCSDAFYSTIRELWVADMKQDWETLPNRNDKENPLIHYGTTLLIAVVTDNWYVTMNLGDGQMVLFNEYETLPIQLVDKEGSAPSSLIYDTYLEDVRRGVWPRKHFSGIAIMTDGMNDRMAMMPWRATHEYLKQTARRFTDHQAPHQPFIFSCKFDGEDRTYDVSRQRNASDDFSIVMALTDDSDSSESRAIWQELRSHYPNAANMQLQRRIGSRAAYLVTEEKSFRFVTVQPQGAPVLLRDARLSDMREGHVRLWPAEERWTKDGLAYAAYPLPTDKPSQFIEEAVQEFAFKTADQYHKVPDQYDPRTGRPLRIVEPLIGEATLRMHDTLRDLEAHLAAQSMRLNETAMHWILRITGQPETLLVPPEAIEDVDWPEVSSPWVWKTSEVSPSLIGYLRCDGRCMPLFGHRVAQPVGYNYYLFTAANADEARSRFFILVYNSKANGYGLKNTSQYTWTLTDVDGKQNHAAPGSTVAFKPGRSITVEPKGLPAFTCTMHAL